MELNSGQGFKARLTDWRTRRRATRDEQRRRRLADARARVSTAQARKDLEATALEQDTRRGLADYRH
jgi:hypothetical protein